jgi:hypothetical protein
MSTADFDTNNETAMKMKSTLGLRGGVFSALVLMGFVGMEARAATLTEWGRVRDDSPQDGSANFIFSTNPNVGDDTFNQLARMVNVFALPSLGSGEYVSTASFSMVTRYLYDQGDNIGAVPDLQFAFIEKGSTATVVLGDYNATPTATYNALSMPSGGGQHTDHFGETQTWSNADLVTAVQNAYDNGNTHIAIRFQLAESSGPFYDSVNGFAISDGDILADYYGVHYDSAYTGTDYGDPTLQLNVIPEPASISLVALFGAAAVFLRRRFQRV